MKRKTEIKAVSMILCVMMLISVIPMTTFAAITNWATENVVYSESTFGTNGYYNVISKKDYVLVPGAATETEMVINNASGTRRQVMHIIEVDPSNPDVSIVPGYYGIDTDWATNVNNQKAAGVTEVARYYEDTLGYNVVGAMNTALSYDNNAPYSFLVYNGEVLVDAKNGINNFHSGSCATMLCVYKDADTGECSVELRTYAQGLRGDEWQAVGANFSMTVNNGRLVAGTEDRTTSAAARSMIGVKEDGTLVLVMNDGRGANNSVGFCDYELGESMLALGCKWAFNCDGGGSSAFVTKRVGEDSCTLRCVPCDGAERPTLNSVLVVSNVGQTGVLNSVNIGADYDVFAPGTAYTFSTKAIDTHGYAMDMPSDVSWALSDPSFGTVENGTFVSNGKLGTVTVQVLVDEKVVGEKEIAVANPTVLKFAQDSTVIPYGKSTALTFISTIGESNVYLDGNSFEYSFSNANAGSLDGFVFTATTDESVAGTSITATYKATGAELIFTVNLGKGSEVLYNFEDGDIGNWKGTDDTVAWLTEHGIAKPLGTLKDGGQISNSCKTTTFLSTRENGGKVHNGNNALGINFDMTQVPFNQWVYGIVYNTAESAVLRDVKNGKNATTLGMWMYIPENFHQTAGKMAFQLTAYVGKDGSGWNPSFATTGTGYSGTQIHFQYNGTNINGLTESQIPENRWIYVTANISSWDYVALVDPLNDVFRSPSFLRTYIKPDVCQNMTWYIDDITLDYSSAVDDRVPPTISDPQYSTNDTNIALSGNPVIDEISAAFTATIFDDNSGIDASTATIYVDGMKVDTKVTGNTMHCGNVTMYKGTHNIKFEVADHLGNITTLTRQITTTYLIDNNERKTDPRLILKAHNDSGETPMSGSVYYIDVIKTAGYSLGEATFTLSVSNCNSWIMDQIVVMPNFDVAYQADENDPSKIYFTVNTKIKTSTAYEYVIATIPVRVYNPILEALSDGSNNPVSGTRFKAPLVVEILDGQVNHHGVYDKLSVAGLDVVRQVNRHEHTAAAVADKVATCTEYGHTGRTYCDVCSSVVDWGTTVPATGHNYVLSDGKFTCSVCGDVYDAGTGLFEINGKNYYAIAGNLVTGWQKVEEDWYYFDPETFTSVKILDNGYVIYEFESDGKLVSGKWYTTDAGSKYYYGPDFYHGNQVETKVEIDGKIYYFAPDGYCLTGHSFVRLSNQTYYQWYEFDEQNALVGEWTYTGFATQNGHTYYVVDGVSGYGMYEVDGAYYYCASVNYSAVVTDITKRCTVNHGLLPIGDYTFAADGKMVDHALLNVDGVLYYYVLGNPSQGTGTVTINDTDYTIEPDGKVLFTGTCSDVNGRSFNYADGVVVYQYKDGIHIEDGVIRYFIHDVPQYAGLVKDGEDYYYIDSNLEGVKDCVFTIPEAKTNGLLPAGPYRFGEDGRMTSTEIVKKNGIVNENGVIRFYIDDVAQYAGLVQDADGSYYYINSAKTAVVNCNYFVSESRANGLLPAGTYHFGADGKMTSTEIVKKNGIVNENGVIRFYIDDVAQYAGLVKDGEDYYYIDSNLKGVMDCIFVIPKAKTNGLLPAGSYHFGADGKMTSTEIVKKNGIVNDNGVIRFYVDDVAQYAGLVQDADGGYYYFNSAKRAVVNCDYTFGVSKANGLLPAGTYHFGADGKITSTKKNGLVNDNGVIRFYVDGVAQYAGLVQDTDGSYYYINSAKKAVVNCDYIFGVPRTNGLLPAGTYRFGASGKMVDHALLNVNGVLYYYVLGKPSQGKGTVTINNADWAINPDGKVLFTGICSDVNGYSSNYVDGVFAYRYKDGINHVNGVIQYFIQDVPQYAGLVQDTDGSYYYINSTKRAVVDCDYFVGASRANGLLPAGTYHFGPDGKMTGTEAIKKNGIVNENGVIRFYVDDVAQYAGLVRDADGSYYYFNSAKRAVVNCDYSVGVSKANGLLPAGTYHFGADGRMTNVPAAE